MLQWEQKYETGFADIDDQHKKLFQVINRLEERIEEESHEDTVNEVLAFLGEYARVHFENEEECMARMQCPLAGRNKTAHRKFIEGYHRYIRMLQQSEDYLKIAKTIHVEMEHWLVNHICKIDVGLKICNNHQPG